MVPYLHELVGPGYRLDHNPLLIMQDPGSEGFEFHGGSTLDNGDWNHPLGYQFMVRGVSISLSLSLSLTHTHRDTHA